MCDRYGGNTESDTIAADWRVNACTGSDVVSGGWRENASNCWCVEPGLHPGSNTADDRGGMYCAVNSLVSQDKNGRDNANISASRSAHSAPASAASEHEASV